MWAPLTAAVVFLVTSWLEFSGTSEKLRRYSDTIHRISLTIGWWRSLTEVDRSNQGNIDSLVNELETLFQTERQSWVSTNMASKMHTKNGAQSGNGGPGSHEAFSETASEVSQADMNSV